MGLHCNQLAEWRSWQDQPNQYGPFDQFPLAASAPFQPPLAPVQSLEGLWGAFGVERGVLIQGSAYGQDHRALLAAIRRDRQNRRGVALVEPATPGFRRF